MNHTALPAAVLITTDRSRAYDFAITACHGLPLTERQRTALVDGAALMLAAGAPVSAAHLLEAGGIPRYLVRCLIRLLNGFDVARWTVRRADTPGDIPVIDDLDRTITVPAWLGYDSAFENVALRMEETTRQELRLILGRRRDWTTTERSRSAPSVIDPGQRRLAVCVEHGARLVDLVPA